MSTARVRVERVGVQLDFHAVGKVACRLVEQDMSAGDHEESILAFEEEAGRSGEHSAAFVEGRHPRRRQQQRFDGIHGRAP